MPSIYDAKPLDFGRVRTVPLGSRRAAKVALNDFAHQPQQPQRPAPAHFRRWLDSLPNILAGKDLREIVKALIEARDARRPILWGVGGHVVKCGLAPVLLALMRERFLTGLAMNGAAAIHDAEIALCGSTSEEVETVITDGSFGMAEETGQLLNSAAAAAVSGGLGLGEALGSVLAGRGGPGVEASLLAGAYRARVPVTVHVALGTDTPHMHPAMDAAAQGAATYHDFRLFAALVSRLEGGGVYLNVGSAVLLPEIFLKAVTVVRNLEHPLANFYTANFDFLQHYRPTQNVVRRPTALGGKGWAITGHHEIMVPLLAALLLD